MKAFCQIFYSIFFFERAEDVRFCRSDDNTSSCTGVRETGRKFLHQTRNEWRGSVCVSVRRVVGVCVVYVGFHVLDLLSHHPEMEY